MSLLALVACLAVAAPVDAGARAFVDDVVHRSNEGTNRALVLPTMTPALADSLIIGDHVCAALQDLREQDELWCPRVSWTAHRRRVRNDNEDGVHGNWAVASISARDDGVVVAQLVQTVGVRRELATLLLRQRDGAWAADVLMIDTPPTTKGVAIWRVDLRPLQALCALPKTPTGPRAHHARTRHEDVDDIDGGIVFALSRPQDRQAVLRGIAHAWGMPCPFAEQPFVSDVGDDASPVLVASLPPLRPTIDAALRNAVEDGFGDEFPNTSRRFNATRRFALTHCTSPPPEVTWLPSPLCGPASVQFETALVPSAPQFDGRSFGAPAVVGVTTAPPLPPLTTTPWRSSPTVTSRVRVQIAAHYLGALRVTMLQEWQRDGDSGPWQLDRVLMPPPASAFSSTLATVPTSPALVALCEAPGFDAIVADTVGSPATFVSALPLHERRAAVEGLVFLQGLERCPLLSR